MPVKYIDVTAVSDLFVAATRAYGDIAIIGSGAAGTAASAPQEFTNPADAVTAYPGSPGTLTNLAAAISLAFKQTPPPVRVWGVQVAATTPDWDAALTAVSKLDVQIVVLANVPLNGSNAALIGKLSDHVSIVSNTGGDGKERIGVAALDPTLSASDAAALNTGKVKNERMFLLAHRSSTDDGAAAAAGVIAGYRPHISMLLKPIAINQTDVFSDTEIDTFNTASINWVTSPVLIPGQATFLGEGYTADPSKNKKYIDIVRTIDDVDFRLKAALIQAIGTVRVEPAGSARDGHHLPVGTVPAGVAAGDRGLRRVHPAAGAVRQGSQHAERRGVGTDPAAPGGPHCGSGDHRRLRRGDPPHAHRPGLQVRTHRPGGWIDVLDQQARHQSE